MAEVAGLILGALGVLPLVIGGAKRLETFDELLKTVPRLRNLHAKLPEMIGDMETQILAFESNMQVLIDAMPINPEKQQRLRAVLGSSQKTAEWHDPDLDALLQARIGPNHVSWFMRKLQNTEDVVKELLGILPEEDELSAIRAQGVLSTVTVRVAYRLYRKDKLVTTLTKLNTEIWDHLQKPRARAIDSLLAPNINAKGKYDMYTKTAGPFLRLQDQAMTLQRLFAPDDWTCSCSGEHPCGIAVQHEYSVGKLALRLEMLLGPLENRRQIMIGFHDPDQQEMDIELGLTSSLSHFLKISNQIHSSDPVAPTSSSPSITKRQTSSAGLKDISPPMKRYKRERSNVQAGSKARHAHATKRHRSRVHFEQPLDDLTSGPVVHSTPEEVGCAFFNPTPTTTSQCLMIGGETLTFNMVGHMGTTLCELASFYSPNELIDARVRLAIAIAYTLLALGPSSWIPWNWGAPHVGIKKRERATPFYVHDDIREALKGIISDDESHSRLTVFSYGQVLLQLLLGRTLDERSLREIHSTSADETPLWRYEVQTRYMKDVADVVDRCVKIEFLATVNFKSADFIHEMKDTVIQPLEEYIRIFNSP